MKKPLFFLKNKPVYQNDILYWEDSESNWLPHVVHHIDDDGHVWDRDEDAPFTVDSGWLLKSELHESPDDCVKKTGWIYIYNHNRNNSVCTSQRIYDSEEQAKKASDDIVENAKIHGHEVTILSINKIEWKQNRS